MWIIFISVGCSVITSVVLTKILATRYFKIVDGYVKDICNDTKDYMKKTKAIVDRL